jgi:hypothetical protein
VPLDAYVANLEAPRPNQDPNDFHIISCVSEGGLCHLRHALPGSIWLPDQVLCLLVAPRQCWRHRPNGRLVHPRSAIGHPSAASAVVVHPPPVGILHPNAMPLKGTQRCLGSVSGRVFLGQFVIRTGDASRSPVAGAWPSYGGSRAGIDEMPGAVAKHVSETVTDSRPISTTSGLPARRLQGAYPQPQQGRPTLWSAGRLGWSHHNSGPRVLAGTVLLLAGAGIPEAEHRGCSNVAMPVPGGETPTRSTGRAARGLPSLGFRPDTAPSPGYRTSRSRQARRPMGPELRPRSAWQLSRPGLTQRGVHPRCERCGGGQKVR